MIEILPQPVIVPQVGPAAHRETGQIRAAAWAACAVKRQTWVAAGGASVLPIHNRSNSLAKPTSLAHGARVVFVHRFDLLHFFRKTQSINCSAAKLTG